MRAIPFLLVVVAAGATDARAQWGSAEARALVERAIVRRQAAFADSTLADWSARAHGFVFFLGQIGEGLAEPPRLIKADQVELEVYWRAPSQSKQRIIGWRDRQELPTDINYHRDHLGIVMNNFPDRIRLGEGDEVRDVPHPVSPGAPGLYEYAVGDSLEIRLPGGRSIRVVEVRFRPRDFAAPRIVGAVFLDLEAAEVVRMTFSFTRAAYRDEQLEDITVAVENALWEGRWWLPFRQEIEIRRRATWLDFPARGIIRGRFDIDGYEFNRGLDPALFLPGPEIVLAPRAVRDSFRWRDSITAEVREIAQPATLRDFDEVRAVAREIAMGHVLTGLRHTQLAGGAVSDFIRVNRVEGLALGAGLVRRSANQANELRLRLGTATARPLATGGLAAQLRRGAWTARLEATREVRDMGDRQVIARLMNSLSAQEAGADFGDYFLSTGLEAGLSRAVGGRGSLRFDLAMVRIESLTVASSWSRGSYKRANPGVDQGTWTTTRLTLRRQAPSFAVGRDFSGRLEVEAGTGESSYLRGYAEVRWLLATESGVVQLHASGGAATAQLPRHRAFVLGGRGSLLGTPFRSFAGRAHGWLSAEWQLPVGVPQLPLGSYASTGRTMTVAPFVAAAWVGGEIAGLPGTVTRGIEPVLGVGLAWPYDLVRVDVGWAVRMRRVGVAVDVARIFWGIL
ncbi:MAG TPA: hypothetical protein VNL98_09635 [Gemmatimonadales bacterium]|nr:hypothetical protein [Gemmatimonadales bacterium]